jgi:tetratricopeptide (TPR) repeat protein
MERQHLANQALGLLSQTPRSDDTSVHLGRAHIAYERGELDTSKDELIKASASAKRGNPLVASIEEMRGLIQEKFGDADGAIEHYKASVAVEPERELPLKRLSELYGIRQDYTNGAMWMERYVATRPLALGHQYGILGDYYLAAQDVPKAIAALRKALEIDAYTFFARYRWAQLYEEQKDNKQATLQYETALKYGFDRDPEIYERLAKLYKAEGRAADALKLVKTGMRIFPTNSDLYRLYGEISRGD